MRIRHHPRPGRRRPGRTPPLVQEEAGIRVSISADLEQAARHAADIMVQGYQDWRDRLRYTAWGSYKRQYFTVAVGGGNTIKAQYGALLRHYSHRVDWVGHVRFFLLEASTGELDRESTEQGLLLDFIVPLARKLIASAGLRALAQRLQLAPGATEEQVLEHMRASMIHPLRLAESRRALDRGEAALALHLARREADRYQRRIQSRLGDSMQFHYLLSGIGRDGALGAFTPNTPELRNLEPAVTVLRQPGGALRVALNRGVLTGAERISLIVAGSRKLSALGRFEMEEATAFEQTVLETPLRMLRETREIAGKVCIFADDNALHFEETVFEYRENGRTLLNKAETRRGEEENGIHAILLHGFMGLFSFTNFLIRLPSAWTVSALHRGSHAKTLDARLIFPYYARVLRKVILQNWRQGRPVPIAGHSIAGIICDHLLLTLVGDGEGPLPAYDRLSAENRTLVDALRAGGLIHLAAWAPTDCSHIEANIDNLLAHRRRGSPLDYSGLAHTYNPDLSDRLEVSEAATVDDSDSLARLGRFLKLPVAAPLVNSVNSGIRYLLNDRGVQRRLLDARLPYVMRLVGARLLKTVSIHGLCKEVDAALHDPAEYQRRHLRALEVLLAYDIPFLCIVHEDDFLVSAGRHREEHEYLLRQRMAREGVTREEDLAIPVRFLMLQREQETMPEDTLNPHLLIMATTPEGNTMARQITAAMTGFVRENVARAIRQGKVKPLASVKKWQAEQRPPPRAGKRPAG